MSANDSMVSQGLAPPLEYTITQSSPWTWPILDAWIFPWNWNTEAPRRSALDGMTVVCVSDTHGQHRSLQMPPGDILIHAGDYTLFGDKSHAVDFNDWLGTLSYRHIVVVQGNHETNAEWKKDAAEILSNARLLRQETMELDNGVRIFGSEFFWPIKSGKNPYYDQIPDDVDIVIAHDPAQGYVDNGRGCPALLNRITQVRPRLLVSGHIHSARAVQVGRSRALAGTTFVNAANAGDKHAVTKHPVVLQF